MKKILLSLLACVLFLSSETVAQNSQPQNLQRPPSLVPLIDEHLPSSSALEQKAVSQDKSGMSLTVYKDVILTRGRKAPLSVIMRRTVVERDKNGRPQQVKKTYMLQGTAFVRGRGDVWVSLNTVSNMGEEGRNKYLSSKKAISLSIPSEFIEDNRILGGTVLPLNEEAVHKATLNTQSNEEHAVGTQARGEEQERPSRRSPSSGGNRNSLSSSGGQSGSASPAPSLNIPPFKPQESQESKPTTSVVSTSGDGCEPIVDHELGIVKTTSRTVRDGVPEGICKPDGNFYPIKVSGSGCSSVLNIAAASVVPEERKYWVGPNGATHYLNACLPSESLSYKVLEDFASCAHRPALDGQTISAFVRLTYTDKDGKQQVAEACRPHGAPIPVQVSSDGCDDFTNVPANIAHPQQEKFATIDGKKVVVSSCAPILTKSWTIAETAEGCEAKNMRVSPTDIRQATKLYYERDDGTREIVIPCTPKDETHTVLKDYDICLASAPPVFDLDGTARAYYRQFYTDARGVKRWISQNCLHGVDVILADKVSREEGDCEKEITPTEVIIHKRYHYEQANGELKRARNCEESAERYEIHEARISCDEEVNSERTLAYKRHRRFYYQGSNRKFIDPECRRALDAEGDEITWAVEEETVGCPVEENVVERKAYIRGKLVYYDDLGNRHEAQDCARSATEAIDMQIDREGCLGLEHNWSDGSSRPYYRLVYEYPKDFERVALSCRSPDEDVPAVAVFRHTVEQCSDFTVAGAKVPSFRIVVRKRRGETEVIKDCEPDLSQLPRDASLSDNNIYRTFAGCEDIDMEHHFDSSDPQAGFSYIPVRKYIMQNRDGVQDPQPRILTDCEIDRSRSYPHREIVTARGGIYRWGWLHNDGEQHSNPKYYLAIDVIEDDRRNNRIVDDCVYNREKDVAGGHFYRANSISCLEKIITSEPVLNPHPSAKRDYSVVAGSHKRVKFENPAYDNTPNHASDAWKGLKYPEACRVKYPLYHVNLYTRPGGSEYSVFGNKDGANTKTFWACSDATNTPSISITRIRHFFVTSSFNGVAHESYTSIVYPRKDSKKVLKQHRDFVGHQACRGSSLNSLTENLAAEKQLGGRCVKVETRSESYTYQRSVSYCAECREGGCGHGCQRYATRYVNTTGTRNRFYYSKFPTAGQSPQPATVVPSSSAWATFWTTRNSSRPGNYNNLPLAPGVAFTR